ncbi:MAG TPA: type II secretion system F family protein [Amnibacterium sp.]|jgi:tight adherence protein B|nr:type II secretion system F family protein [Amnibacterium sp.]
MIPALGALGGAGLLLVVSPLLWPPTGRTRRARRGAGRIADRLERAGVRGVAPGLVLPVSALLGLAAGALAEAITGLPAVAALAGLAAGVAPWAVLGRRARGRVRAARALWPVVVDALVASVRAGMPLPDAIAALATEGPAPLRPGFALFEQRWRETGTAAGALDAAKAHFADPTADRLIEILRMARQVGGAELPSVLRDLAIHLRADLALRAEMEARQSWVTGAGRLGLAAPWIVLVLLATRPEGAAAYATSAGAVLIVGAAAVTLIAYRAMVAIGRLPEDRRWFR